MQSERVADEIKRQKKEIGVRETERERERERGGGGGRKRERERVS